jgi:hypothetical protein
MKNTQTRETNILQPETKYLKNNITIAKKEMAFQDEIQEI